MNPENAKLKMIKAGPGLDELLAEIATGETWKADQIKPVAKEKTVWEVKNPTEEDHDNTVIIKKFYAVICHIAAFEQPHMNDANKMVPKRVLTLLRASNGLEKTDAKYLDGRKYPETVWASSTGTKCVGKMLSDLKTNWGKHFTEMLVEVTLESAEMVKDKMTIKWNKPVLTPVRELTDREKERIALYVAAVAKRAEKYKQDEDYSDLETEAGIDVRKPKAEATEEEAHTAAARKREIDDEDTEDDVEDEAAKKAAAKKAKADKKAAEAAAAKAAAASDDEEEDDDAEAKAAAAKKAAAEAAKLKAAAADDEEEDPDDAAAEKAKAAAAAKKKAEAAKKTNDIEDEEED